METRARHVLIGLFTLIVAALAVLFALWLGRSEHSRDFHLYDIAFEEAVSGLSRDATGLEAYCRTVVDGLGDVVAVFKPQVAFFEVYGSAGFAVL